MSTKRRIAILWHASQRRLPRQYLVDLYAKFWREDGHEVFDLYGTESYVPADIAIVHVDLSVVPESYLELARRYPVAVNGRVPDIRKSTISQNLLRRDDPYSGPVIVKTDLNYAGHPERRLLQANEGPVKGLLGKVRRRLSASPLLTNRPAPIWKPGDYQVFDSLRDVPQATFAQSGLVVERFQPEMDGDRYCVRVQFFLGSRDVCIRFKGRHPIVNGPTVEVVEIVEPHPDTFTWRDELHLDFGKFDYVVTDGRAVLFDANKTVGWSRSVLDDDDLTAQRRHRARGLYEYFPD